MKIGIVSVPDAANFGSFLQAYCLQITLQKLGHEVYFIRTRSKKYINNLFCPFNIYRVAKHPLREINNLIFMQQQKKYYEKCWQKFSIIDEKETELDIIILGSDAIWSVKSEIFRAPIFYGIGLKCKSIKTYAVSVGGMKSYEDFVKYDYIVNAIKTLQPPLVRDNLTKDYVDRIRGDESLLVCDPTFLIDTAEYTEDFCFASLAGKKYMLIYAYYVNERMKNYIQKFANAQNLLVVSVGFRYDWCDYSLHCSPLQFSSVIKNAEYIYAASFHGVVFSLLNNKTFVTTDAVIKAKSLLNDVFSVNDMILSESIEYQDFEDKLVKFNIDYLDIRDKILKFRKNSIEALRNSLQI